jgi:hypothetical protein
VAFLAFLSMVIYSWGVALVFHCRSDKNFLLFYLFSSFLKNYCAGWGYIVAFTKVLTLYQIYPA